MEPTTKSKVNELVSSSAVWKLENWKNHHKILASEAHCDLTVDGVELRFFLRPFQKIFHMYEAQRENIVDYYSLWVEPLNHHHNIFLKVTTKHIRANEDQSREIINDSFVSLKKTKDNPGCAIVVDQELILAAVWTSEGKYGSKSLASEYASYCMKTLDDLEISITATLCTFAQQEENSTFGIKRTKEVQDSLPESLQQILLEKGGNSFADIVTLQMRDDVNLKGHRAILSAASPVFEAMLSSDFKENQKQTVEIPDVNSNVMEILLWYMYTGSNTVSGLEDPEFLEQVIYGAAKYQLAGLLEYCDCALVALCKVTNVMSLLKVANKYNLDSAKLKLTKFAETHSLEIVTNQLETL